MELKTGDKVICKEPTGYLVKDQTYTVDAVFKRGNDVVSITVNECVVHQGYNSYRVNRFDKVRQPNLIAITDDEIESIVDACIALDYFSEGAYVNMSKYGSIVDKIEGQVKLNNN